MPGDRLQAARRFLDGVVQLVEVVAGVRPGDAVMHDLLGLCQADPSHGTCDLDHLNRREAVGPEPVEDDVPFLAQGIHTQTVFHYDRQELRLIAPRG